MSFLENNCFILCLSILLMAGCDTSSQTPQPRMITDSALPPVGIENKDSDCYLISLAQLILNSPDFLAAFKKVAHKNPIYSDLVEAYQKAQQEKTFLLTGEGSAFRKFKQYLHKLYGDDVCKPGASSAPGFVFLKIVKIVYGWEVKRVYWFMIGIFKNWIPIYLIKKIPLKHFYRL